MPPLVDAAREVEAVVVHRLEETLEGSQGGAPHRMLQVVARAVVAAVLLVEADIRAVVESPVRCASRKVGNHFQEAWRH